MTALLLVLIAVAGAVAYRRMVRRIDALEARIERLTPPLATPAIAAPGPRAERSLATMLEARPEPPSGANPEPKSLSEPQFQIAPATAAGGFEALVGGRLPIWVGGAALAIGGYFLVVLAIEAGLLGPLTRIALAAAAGLALVAAAELGRGWAPIARDPRVAQALSGAGLAMLYATAYLASAGYGLIGPLAAFAMMAAVTGAALALALRHGAPTAVLGLVGGFATPLLAGGAGGNAVALLIYLSLISGGLFALALRRGWPWLALATAAGGLFWSGVLIASGDPGEAMAAGLFAAIVAGAVIATSAGGRAWWRAAPAAVALVELAVLLGNSGFGIEGWALYLSLSAGALWLAMREPRVLPLAAGALVLSIAALIAHASVPAGIAIAGLFGGVGFHEGRRDDDVRWAAIGAVALLGPWLVVRFMEPIALQNWAWGLSALPFAAAALFAARGPATRVTTIALGAAAVLAGMATVELAPLRWAPLAFAVITLAFSALARRDGGGDRHVLVTAGFGVTLLAMAALASGVFEALGASLGGARVLLPMLPDAMTAGVVLLLPCLPLAVALRGSVRREWAAVVAAAGIAGGYVLAKQAFAIGDEAAFVTRGFAERATITQALFLGALVAARRWPMAGRVLAVVALGRVIGLDLLIFDPVLVAQAVGHWPLVNWLVLHFALATSWAAWWWAREERGRGWLIALVAVAGGGLALAVRQAFHGRILNDPVLSRGELWSYSAAGLALAAVLLAAGARTADRPLRIAGLTLLTATVCKVFLIDAAALEGVLRILSFMGLGAALIAIGWGYGRFLGSGSQEARHAG